MLQHNIKLAFRNFKKDKSTFLINLVGLSTGLACTILIFMWVNDEINVDKFHANQNQIYQVLSNHDQNGQINTWRDNPAKLPETLMAEMPEVKDAVGLMPTYDINGLTFENNYLNAKGRFVGDNFFKIFSFDLIEGNSEKIFPDKNGIVISEKLATNFFDSPEDAIGETISYKTSQGKTEVVVSGVFNKVPKNSSLQFDFLISYEKLLELIGEGAKWDNFHSNTFVKLHDDADFTQFDKKIRNLMKEKMPETSSRLLAQKFSETYLHNNYENGVVVGGRINYVRLFSLIALFILLIACINFMNLSTANATRKYKEIGVKKTIGADRQTLIFQYLGESLLLSFFALAIAMLIVFFALPEFNQITNKELTLHFSPTFYASIIGITFLTGIISGSYPALYISGFSPAKVFKGNIKNSWGELWARKGLVVFQFAISLILIVSVSVVYKQIEFIQNKNLGFSKDNLIHFKFQNTESMSQDVFIDEVKNISGVTNASSMWGSFVDQTASTGGAFDWEGKDPNLNITFDHFSINFDMLEMLNVKTAEGRTFSKDFSNENTKIIFNETGIKAMGLKNPIGKTFSLWGDNYEIVGIVKDFHFQSLYKNITPFFFRMIDENDADKILVKIQAGQEQNTLAQIESFYKKNNPSVPFEYQFLDADYQQLYESENRVSILSKYFAGFAIIISCLGLFGLAAFTAQRRIKEISIRKVLGANPFSIIRLLTLDFTKMVLIAILIGLPISYFMARNWLDDFAFSINLSVWFFIMAGLLTLAIAWLTVSLQTMKAARVNPVNNLKE